MIKDLFGDVLFVIFYTLVFVCWAFIFAYGFSQLNKKKKK